MNLRANVWLFVFLSLGTSLFIALAIPLNAAYAAYKCYDHGNKVDVTNAFLIVEKVVKTSTQKLSELQLLLTKRGGYSGNIDGRFGQGTAESLCGVVQLYLAIGGWGESWKINSASDVPQFIEWLYTAVNADETGGEFPD